MSKNIVIQEGGVGKQLTVDKLKTNIVGGGTCLWVPEDERQLGTKYISENGTYRASADGYYGYSEVTVSGVGTATGKDPDGSGDDATATVDPETGKIVITKQPSSIEVITPPTNPYGIYQNGQTITKDGMVVKAYYESGGEYGTVPNGEATLNPTTAVYDSSTDTGKKQSSTIDDPAYAAYHPPVMSYSRLVVEADNDPSNPQTHFSRETSGDAWCVPYLVEGTLTWVWISTSRATLTRVTTTTNIATQQSTTSTSTKTLSNSSTTQISRTIFYYEAGNYGGLGWGWQQVSLSPNDFDEYSINAIATILIDGTSTEEQAGSRQTITVSWPRPGDGKVLETTFEILVAPGYTPNGGE